MIYSAKAFAMFPAQNSKEQNNKWYSLVEFNKLDGMTHRFYFNIFKQLIMGIAKNDLKAVKKAHTKIYEIQKMYSANILPSKKRVSMEIKYNHLQIFPSLIWVY